MSLESHFESRVPLLLELGFRQDGLPALKSYVQLLWSANQKLNLVSRQMTFEDLIDNHIIDGLLALKQFPMDVKNIADFGSGGGIPGVVYAIHFSDKQFILFEKSIKKQEFLKSCLTLSPNLVVKGDIPVHLDSVQLVMARAFKPLDVILDMSRNYFQKGGRYFLLKGRLEKINEEQILTKQKFKNLTLHIEPLKSPILEVERHLVTIP